MLFVFSVAFSATPMQSDNSMSLYGYETLFQELEFSDNQFDDDDDEVDRKRRHRRRRKIRPPQKGW